jgi:hypothetical protein
MKKEEKQRRQQFQRLNKELQNEIHRDPHQINFARIHEIVAEINSANSQKAPQTSKFDAWQYNRALIELNHKVSKPDAVIGALICPQCGDSDRGNTMNGKSWCFKCQVALILKDKMRSIIKLVSLREELKKVTFIDC